MYDSQTIIFDIILPAIGDTSYMLFYTTIFSTIIGFVLAVISFMTKDNGLNPMLVVNRIVNFIINVIRSFPFIILMVAIIPLTRAIVGTSIGQNAAIVPLTIGTSSFIARLFINSFNSVDADVIEAGRAFGLTNFQIIRKIVFKESIPNLTQDLTLAIITALGSSAMAGTVGAGGLGAVAMMYGYQNFNDQIMYGTVIILIIIVQFIQFVGNKIYDRQRV